MRMSQQLFSVQSVRIQHRVEEPDSTSVINDSLEIIITTAGVEGEGVEGEETLTISLHSPAYEYDSPTPRNTIAVTVSEEVPLQLQAKPSK